jgi:hypothetical protein
MTINSIETKWVSLRKGDIGFTLEDNCIVASRAWLEIKKKCPKEYTKIIMKAYQEGYIDIVATVPKSDPTLMWDILKK